MEQEEELKIQKKEIKQIIVGQQKEVEEQKHLTKVVQQKLQQKSSIQTARVSKLEKTITEFQSQLDSHRNMVLCDTDKVRGQERFLVKMKRETNF